jgi:hypothetical protein
MSGTSDGNKKAAQTTKQTIWSRLLQEGRIKVVAEPQARSKHRVRKNPELAREAGRRGGLNRNKKARHAEKAEDEEILYLLAKEASTSESE